MSATATPITLTDLDDIPDGEETRYGIYVLRDGQPARVAETSKAGIGPALVQLYEDRREAGDGVCPVVGILDRIERRWITSLWTKGTR